MMVVVVVLMVVVLMVMAVVVDEMDWVVNHARSYLSCIGDNSRCPLVACCGFCVPFTPG